MATYREAAHAKELIREVANRNNSAIDTLNALSEARDKLSNLNATQRGIVESAVADMGYDMPEIVAILDRWAQVRAAALGQGVGKVLPS